MRCSTPKPLFSPLSMEYYFLRILQNHLCLFFTFTQLLLVDSVQLLQSLQHAVCPPRLWFLRLWVNQALKNILKKYIYTKCVETFFLSQFFKQHITMRIIWHLGHIRSLEMIWSVWKDNHTTSKRHVAKGLSIQRKAWIGSWILRGDWIYIWFIYVFPEG